MKSWTWTSQLRAAAVGVGRDAGQDIVKSYLARRRQNGNQLRPVISNLNLYNHTLTPQEKLILRVTRLFGECESAAPPEYLAEVGNYIAAGRKPRPSRRR